ncbi:CocE/NonD family hydrolase, partial [Novipirellula sp.]|uniref:CocE/NonD family hydrolase n=1 Tax=Novipirellula sp. TaxID=2795430 RepID=UPI0035660A3D
MVGKWQDMFLFNAIAQRQFRWAFLIALVIASGSFSAAADYVVQRDVMVPMRDGVRLATDVYRPAVADLPVDEALPVILSRLPYNKAGSKLMGAYYATHGYVFVAQDTRGRYNSEGVWHMLTDDGP